MISVKILQRKDAKRNIERSIKIITVINMGCNGFDGDVESRVASSVECHLKRLKLFKYKR